MLEDLELPVKSEVLKVLLPGNIFKVLVLGNAGLLPRDCLSGSSIKVLINNNFFCSGS